MRREFDLRGENARGRRRDDALALRGKFIRELKHRGRFAACADERNHIFRSDTQSI